MQLIFFEIITIVYKSQVLYTFDTFFYFEMFEYFIILHINLTK